jgi:hypothetical protein
LALLASAMLLVACDTEEPDDGPSTPPVTPQNIQTQPANEATDGGGGAASDGGRLLPDASVVTERMRTALRSREPEVLEIDQLLSRGEVRELTQYTGSLREIPLEGQPPSESYNAVRFAADTSYGLGIQMWQLETSDDASRHFQRLRDTYVATEAQRIMAHNGFSSTFGGIRQIVFMSRGEHAVVAVSCDETLCPRDGVLTRVAERIGSRL